MFKMGFVVQSLSRVWLFVTPWTAAHPVTPSFTISLSLLKRMSFESVMPSNHLFLCCPLLLLPSVFLSIRVFSSELALCIRWPKCWSFSFNISPSNPFRVDFLYNWLAWSCCPRVSVRVFSSSSLKAIIFRHSASFLWSNSHIHTWLLEKPQLWLYGPLSRKWNMWEQKQKTQSISGHEMSECILKSSYLTHDSYCV